MTDTPEFDATAAARGAGAHAAHHYPSAPAEQPTAHMRPIAALQAAADALARNPLIAAITSHPGMGQHLSDRDIDAVMRVIASIESARIEVPTRYEQAAAARAAQDGQG